MLTFLLASANKKGTLVNSEKQYLLIAKKVPSTRIWGLLMTLTLGLFFSLKIYAQDTNAIHDLDQQQIDLADVIRSALGKEPKENTGDASSLILMPIIGSNPATGFMVGVGGQYAFKMKESTKYSLFSGSVQATTKGQLLFLFKNNVYTKSDRMFLSGDWRFQIFSQATYGLGTNAPDSGILDYQFGLAGQETTLDSLAQQMSFNLIRVHQTVTFKIKPSFYLGFGYNLDGFSKIVDEKLRLNPGDTLITSHYAYNTTYGFDLDKYYSSAIAVNLVYDTRDNMINPYNGFYASASWRGSMEFLGSDRTGNFYQLEWRSYHGLSKKNPRHLIGFWLMGNLSEEGDYPYLILPATAYDQKGRSARGYTQGRYRGTNYVYGEAEYRFPISDFGGLWGGVVFLNASTANNEAESLALFESVKPGYGFGVRLMVDKRSRTNLAIDYGFGDRSSGFYLAVSETF